MIPLPDRIPTLTITDDANQTRISLSWMHRMAHAHCAEPEMVELARSIVAGIPNEDAIGMAQAVQDWIRAQITYRSDPAQTQYLQDVPVTLTSGSGNCDCMTILATCLMRALGHDAFPLGVIWSGGTDATHAVCWDDTAGAILDPVSGGPVRSWPPSHAQLGAFVAGGF